MILKFLYQFNENNKRVITGIVHNDEPLEYVPDYQYPMVLEESYEAKPNEEVTYNYGAQYYAVFSDDTVSKYLNFNDYMLQVRLGITANAAFAASLSKNLLTIILEETNYFNTDLDVNYVDSGLYLAKNKEYKDIYEGWFKKVTDDVYVELANLRYPLFVGKENNEYILTDDFSKAFRVSKKECRNVLIAKEFIDKDISKRNISFSHFNIFMCENGYAFGGLNSFQVTFDDDILKITKNIKLTCSHRLIQDETRAGILRDICYLMKNENTTSTAYLKVNGKYLKQLSDNTFELIDEAASASAIDLNQIEIIKKAFGLFHDNYKFEVLTDKNYFVYTHKDYYELSKDVEEAIPSKVISKEDYETFIEAFNNDDKKQYIINDNDKYVSINQISNLKFSLSYSDSAYKASKFSLEQVKALSKVLDKTFARRELIPIFNSSELYHIKSTKAFYTISEAFENFKHMLKNSNIKFSDNVIINELKTESDKGSFEYLKRFYLKTLFDSYYIFKKVLADETVNNVLLTGTTSTADIMGLSIAAHEAKREINVVTLENSKWGVYPNAYIADNLNYEASYRLALTALDKATVSHFDAIYFGKSFKENPDKLFTYFKEIEKPLILADLSLNGEFGIPNYFYKAIIQFDNIARRYLNYDAKLLQSLALGSGSIIDKKSTYYSLAKLNEGKIEDLLEK